MSTGRQTLALIPARAGSEGVPGKNVRPLLGRPVIAYTIDAALASPRLNRIAVTSDDPRALEVAQSYPGVATIQRPAHLGRNTSRIDDVLRHAVATLQERHEAIPDALVLLYANIPVRSATIIDRVVDLLYQTGADSVQTLCPVGKYHPYWLYQTDAENRISKYIDNAIFRRQELPPLYAIDGAVLAVRTAVLMATDGQDNPHAFLGRDRRTIIQEAHETVDIDNERDFYLAEAVLRLRNERQTPTHPDR